MSIVRHDSHVTLHYRLVAFNAPAAGRLVGVLKRLDEAQVVIDFNHPLAGAPLRWSVQVIGVL